MTKFIRIAVASLSLAAGISAMVGSADAHMMRHHGHWHHHHHCHWHHHHRHCW